MELNEEVVEKSLDWLDSLVGNSNDSDMAIFTYQLLGILYDTCEELTEENERLRAENAKYEAENHAEFNKWLKLEEATKRHHAELFEEAKIAVKAETVQKYKSAIIEYYSKPKYQPTKEHPIKHTQIEYLFAVLDQIAKELLEGEK